MSKKSLWWKIPLWVVGVLTGIVLLLLIIVTCVLYGPSLRKAALNKGISIASDRTEMDIDYGRIYLSPFHHGPSVLYRAYKGRADLPLTVEIDSLFVGHRGQDTLLYTHSLRLKAKLLTGDKKSPFSDFTSIPIVVEQLYLDQTTFHSDSMIPSVGIDAVLDLLDVTSPEILIAEGKFPLHGLRLYDADVSIDLRETPPDTLAQDTLPHDTTPMPMAFEVPDGDIRNLRFRLNPMGMGIQVDHLATNALADVGANLYDARKIDIGGLTFSLGDLSIPADTIYGDARVDLANNQIISNGMHVRSDEMGAKADLSATEMNLETMRVDVTGEAEYQGSKVRLSGSYDIDDEAYDMHVDVERVNLSAFLKDQPNIVLAGEIEAQGQGIDPSSKAMNTKVYMRLKDAVYDNINISGVTLDAQLANKTVNGKLHLPVTMKDPDLQVKAKTEHQFRVSDFIAPERMKVDYHTQMKGVKAKVGGDEWNVDHLNLDFATGATTSLDLNTEGLRINANSPMHVLTLLDELQPLLNAIGDTAIMQPITSLTDLTQLDTIRRKIPALNADITLRKGSPVQAIIDSTGLAIDEVSLVLNSDAQQTDLRLNVSTPDIGTAEDSTSLRLPATDASFGLTMTEGKTNASLAVNTLLTEGAMSVSDLCTDAGLRLDIVREGNTLHGDGRLTLDSLSYGATELGNRSMDMHLSPSQEHTNALRADVRLDDIPLELVKSFVSLTDINLRGAIRASASVDGLPGKTDISAEVQPIGVAAEYTPYQIGIGLGETPIIMRHNHVDLNGLPIYGADSTYLSLTGGLDLDSMRLDVALEADSFAPVKLPKGGALPVYGELATDIHGRISGALDSIVADVELTLLPTTDITYPIDKKNLAQVKPHGTVRAQYGVADGSLDLGGQINVDDGFIRYSPKIYPVMPFHVDSGSHILFQGPIGKTKLAVSASQKVKADVESDDQDTRRVDFITGVRVNGELDSIGIESIGFFLEAPDDESITRELASVDEETREGLAATLLATGMYVGESNEAVNREGYALSSIINSRINAALANSKMGKFIDVDISSGQSTHAGGKTNDMNISISKSFFKEKLRITLGSTLTDNPEINETHGLFNQFAAEYKLTKDGNVLLRLFSQRDYNNILEGELYKSGLGVRATKDWRRQELFRGDSITRTYGLTADAGVAYRSNNSIGPDVTLKSSIKNVLGKGETFTIKGNGAYFWALRNRHPGDPKKTDTYKLGVNASLVFPYLHWAGENNPDGDTRYMLGYQYENIAGGYGVHKFTGSLTYFIHSPNSSYITHAFTPFSLSVVRMKAESDSLLNKAAEYPQLIKVIAGDEFIPSIGYNFIYNDYRSKHAVNTYFNLGVKESGNLLNALYCALGYKWNDVDKPLGSITFNQFVKLSAELRNKFNLTDKVCIATRLFAGANIPLGNSNFAPLSEAFYTGGPNSLRAASPYAYGPGNFYSAKYNQNFFHSGDVKLEANFELRFPIVWKLYGAAFLDAGNVWNWFSTVDLFKAAGYDDYLTRLEIPETLRDGIFNNPDFARQIALGTGAGLRLDIDGLVVRLDIGVGIHSPYQTFRYDKERKPDPTQPINTYFNIPSALDAIRINFGIGYPF